MVEGPSPSAPRARFPLNMYPKSKKDDAGVFAGRDGLDPEKVLKEKRRMLANTRAFLQLICDSQDASRRYIEEMEGKLAHEVRRLETELHRDAADASVPDKGDTH